MGRLTLDRPKHLLEVAGEPFVVHQLRWLSSHGVVDVVLATSFLADQFAPVLGDGSRWGVRLRYSVEPSPMGTGGGLAAAARVFGELPERLVVVNGDLLTGHDLTAQLDLAETGTDIDAVLHLRTVPDPRAFGSVVADANGRVSSFTEKSEQPTGNEVNAGTYVLARQVIEQIPTGVVSLETEVLPTVVEQGRAIAYREQALWEDVGSPAALVRASRLLVTASGRPFRADPDAEVASDALLAGGSAIGRGARICSASEVIGSVVMAGARIGVGARVVSSVIGPGADVPDGASVVDDLV